MYLWCMVSLRFVLDFTGALFGLGYMFGIAKRTPWAWPLGIISCCFFAWLCHLESMWTQAAVQWLNVLLGFWGWYSWNKNTLPRTMTSRQKGFLVIMLLISALILFLGVGNNTLPWVDWLCLVCSLVATVLTIRMFRENWYLWMVVNGTTAWIAFEGELYFLSGLSTLYFLLSIYGQFQWRNTQ